MIGNIQYNPPRSSKQGFQSSISNSLPSAILYFKRNREWVSYRKQFSFLNPLLLGNREGTLQQT